MLVEKTTTTFHGKAEHDYQGRSWMTYKAVQKMESDGRDFEADLEAEKSWCFLPKKCLHTYTGHTGGIQAIRLFPNTGHLFLTAGLDNTVKIWDFYNDRKCFRDYTGHDFGVRDVQFTHDGSRFYSTSFDKNINMWDTETGKIITVFTNKKTHYCISVRPNAGEDNIFITGCSNKKAVQWDARAKPSEQIVQEYDEHLGTVNSVTWCENGKKLMTTGDDKKILIWEYGIPVVTKYIQDPSMHSELLLILSYSYLWLPYFPRP